MIGAMSACIEDLMGEDCEGLRRTGEGRVEGV